jgi:UDP-N-acetylmuramoyl-tripeptide--D-alanyl-D-alanine ligase
VIEWDAARFATAADARLVRGSREDADVGGPSAGRGRGPGPRRVTIDSRAVHAGDLFVGLPGERVDGGSYAERALEAGAWGVLVAPAHAARVGAARGCAPGSAGGARTGGAACGTVLAHPDPLAALQTLARAWRRELGAKVVAITGSTGKTSTKDILAALLAQELATVASPQNLNTEIGLPLAVLAAPRGTEALVLEMAMRGPAQIAELVAIAEPDVGVIVNVGPVHLELLGSLVAIAAAKAELIAGMAPGATVVIPAGERLLAPHLRADLRTVTFGDGGDVELVGVAPSRAPPDGVVRIVEHVAGRPDLTMSVRPSFSQSHNLRNLLAAVAAARTLGVTPGGKLHVTFSALRGERIALADGIVLINDCYNANPMSMRAALDDLAATAPARQVAVLGDMLELGTEQGAALHREVAAHASARGVELLVTVGSQAAEMGETFAGEVHRVPAAAAAAALLPGLLRPRDTVLIKGSRGVGLELVAETLATSAGASGPAGTSTAGAAPAPAAGTPTPEPGEPDGTP